ncbi:MAG TPA: SDR family NAD(P)-dependent oxidoreductase, partial [Ignavibacteria bacterium]
MNNRWSLKDKKALVTGASRGIGKAIAGELESFGAEVFSVSRNYKRADGIKCDVTDAGQRKELYDEINKKWG